MTMEHRHINFKDNEWNVAVVHSIWEHGLEKDICALIREVKTKAKAVDAVKSAIQHSKVYGWPKFFKLYIENSWEKMRKTIGSGGSG